MPNHEVGSKCEHSGGGGYCFGAPEPDFLAAIPLRERKNVLADGDLCLINDRHFFIRGFLDLPILGTAALFSWMVWVSLSEENFYRAVDLWETPGREKEPPYFGWLNTRIPGYPDTSELKTNVHTLAVGLRPKIVLEPTSHPLAIEQQMGITVARAENLAKLVMAEWI